MIIHYYTDGDIPEIKMSGRSIISKTDRLVSLEVQETENSYRYRAIMSKPQLVLRFSLPAFIEIPVGAWVEYMGQTFTLNDPENIKKQGTRNIEYTMTMGTDEDLMGLYKMRNSVDHRLRYSMCATPREFIQEIVANLNERSGGGWSVGTCIESTEKTIEFNHSYIDDAIQSVAETFETEWEIVGKVISLRKVEYFKNDPLPLSYGKGNGFVPGVGRSSQSDEKPIKRLYVQGGDRNIDRSKYGSKELLLPKNQTLIYQDRIYKTDNDGYYIERIDEISDAVKEDSLDLSEIYPSRIGSVSGVVEVDAEKNYYDIIDASIPNTLNYENYLIEGETMTIIFQSGMLAGDGKEFEVRYFHEQKTIQNPDGTTTIKAARRFEIVPQEIDGIIMPNNTFKPAVGDSYAVFGCSLPDEYVCDNVNQVGASWDMFREGARYLYEHEEQKFTFTGTLQGLWAKQNWANIGGHLKVGAYILFSDEQFAPEGKSIRITGIKDFLTSPYTPTIEISSSVSGVTASSKMKKIDAIDVEIEDVEKSILSFTKRRFRDAKETIGMLNALIEAGFDNFTNGINPITVQTMSMLVGDESLQFRFVNRKTDPIVEVPAYVSYNQNTKQLTIPQGIVQHMTLGIDTVKASHDPSEYKFWDVAAFTSGRLQDGTKKYYLYIRANRADTDAVFYLSETAHKLTEGDTYYWLLMGVLNSEYDGERSYASLYGFTEVLPGRVTTQKIVSPDGKTYFDLVLGEIGGNIRIKAGSSGLENLAEWAQLAQDLADMNEAIGVTAEAVDDLGDYVDGAFADGIITEAEAIAIQKYINTVNNSKNGILATYTTLYANAYLSGDPKTNLLNAKVTLMGSIDDLLTSINTAIADGKTTPTEKADVDTKFALFNSALSDFNTAVENANKAIQDALKAATDLVAADLVVANGKIQANASSIDTVNNTINTAGWITKGDGNTWWAKKELEDGNEIISYINQSATTTTIASNKINLVGAVTFSMFSSELQGTINGKANSSDLGSLASLNSIAWSNLASALQTTISGKANTSDLGDLASLDSVAWSDLAQAVKNTINAKANSDSLGSLAFLSSVSTSELATALKNTINGKANSSDLGSMAGKSSVSWSDLATALQSTINSKIEASYLDNDIITFSRLGSTIVEGGYIKTSLLNVIKIAAVEGTIAGLKISDSSIVSTSGAYDGGSQASALNSTQFHLYAKGNSNAYLGYSGSNVRAEIGLNTYNGSSSQKIMCDLRDTAAAAYTYTKIGLYVDIYDTYNAKELEYNANVTTNIGATAIYINRGHVTGLKRHLRHVSGNNTAYMTKDDSLVHFHNTNTITAYLPDGCEDGQEIWVLPWNTRVTVKTRSGQYIHIGDNNDATEVNCDGSTYHIFIYSRYNGRWVFGFTGGW